MASISEVLSLKWFRKRDEAPAFPIPRLPEPAETEYRIPPLHRSAQDIPPAVFRHLRVLEIAMIEGDRETVGNRQLRLAKLGMVEVPTKLSQVRDMMEVYGVTQASD